MKHGKLSAIELFIATIVDARSLLARVMAPKMRKDITLRGDIERYLDATSAFAKRDGMIRQRYLLICLDSYDPDCHEAKFGDDAIELVASVDPSSWDSCLLVDVVAQQVRRVHSDGFTAEVH